MADSSVENQINRTSPSLMQTTIDPKDIKVKCYLYGFILTVGIGSFLFGYSIGVFNTLQDDFAFIFGWSHDEKKLYTSLITSMCSLGSAVGAISIGFFTKHGKRKCIIAADAFVIVGASLTLVKSIPMIACGRVLFGISAGAFSVLVPGFINELSPIHLKGPLGTITQILIANGVNVSFFLGLPIPDFPLLDKADENSFVVQNYWRVMFAIPIALAILQSFLLLTIFKYETPKFLKQHNKYNDLNSLLGNIYQQEHINHIISTIVIEQGKHSSPTYTQTLCSSKYYYATMVGCCLSAFQQLSGINSVMFYSSQLFTSVGYSGRYGTAIIGIISGVAVFVSMPLLKRFGRRQLLIVFSFVLAADMVGYGVSFYFVNESGAAKIIAVVFILFYKAFFQFSLGPIPWLYMAEVMTDKGLSIAVLINWLLVLLVAIVTPFLISGTLFIVYGGFCFLSALFAIFILKETKGLTEDEVQQLYSKEKDTSYNKIDSTQL